MARTPSTQTQALGDVLPAFSLPEPLTGKTHDWQTLQGPKGTVVFFTCNHCPYVLHIENAVLDLARTYLPQDIHFVAINANDVETYPDDAPERMAQRAKDLEYPFPYLFDEDQSVARAFDAACTPDFFVADAKGACLYRGRFDAATPGNDTPVTGVDLKAALDALLNGLPPVTPQHPSLGCNIKWKPAS